MFGMLFSGCSSPWPLRDGEIWEFTPAGRRSIRPTPDSNALRIHWLGSASYSIELGDASILTDPFYTYHGMVRTGLLTIWPDREVVRKVTADVPKPQAIFIGHSHYDHMLDVAELVRCKGWEVPIVGSESTKNILSGMGCDLEALHQPLVLGNQWRPVPSGDGSVSSSIEYKAAEIEHAPQLLGIHMYPGTVDEPLKRPPTRAGEFKEGGTFAILFKLHDGERVFTILFMNSATKKRLPEGFITEPVDVAILCVPGWKNAPGYPDHVIEAARPGAIVLSHYDNFLQKGRHPPRIVATASINRFIEKTRRHLGQNGFERILVPDVGVTMTIALR